MDLAPGEQEVLDQSGHVFSSFFYFSGSFNSMKFENLRNFTSVTVFRLFVRTGRQILDCIGLVFFPKKKVQVGLGFGVLFSLGSFGSFAYFSHQFVIRF